MPDSTTDFAAFAHEALADVGLDVETFAKWRKSPTGKRLDAKAEIVEKALQKRLTSLPNAEAESDAIIAAALSPALRKPTITPIGAFVCKDRPILPAFLGTPENAILRAGSDGMLTADGGAGKTTLAIDATFHMAAGEEWCGWPVEQPVTALLIENEGGETPYAEKLERKLNHWEGGDGPEERIFIWEEPWGKFSFADEGWREYLAEGIKALGIELLIAGPITTLGMQGHGTIPETRAFNALIVDVREKCGLPIGSLAIHHDRKEGGVSGAWEGTGDTLLELATADRGLSKLKIGKARLSSKDHKQTYSLKWAPNEGFVREEKVDKTPAVEVLLEKAKEKPNRSEQTLTPEEVRLPVDQGGVGCSLPNAKAILADLVLRGCAVEHKGKDVGRPKAKKVYEAADSQLTLGQKRVE
jgi:hypothetical protein